LLDAALELADRLNEFGIADAAVARVTALFPEAPVLKRREADMAVAGGDFSHAAVLLQAIAGAEESAAFYGALGELVPSGTFDHDIVLAELVRRNPTWRKGGHRALVREAARRGQLYHAFRWAFDAPSSLFSPDLLLEVMERMVLERAPAGDIPIATEDSESAVRRLVRYLADNPTAAGLRVRLVRWLEPSSLGLTGLTLILRIALAQVFRTPCRSHLSRHCRNHRRKHIRALRSGRGAIAASLRSIGCHGRRTRNTTGSRH
jgi:hypothetical protein